MCLCVLVLEGSLYVVCNISIFSSLYQFGTFNSRVKIPSIMTDDILCL